MQKLLNIPKRTNCFTRQFKFSGYFIKKKNEIRCGLSVITEQSNYHMLPSPKLNHAKCSLYLTERFKEMSQVKQLEIS